MPLSTEDPVKWGRAQARLRATVGSEKYSTWLVTLRLGDIRETIMYCSVPTTFLKHWIEKHYAKSVVECVRLEWPEITAVYILHRQTGQPLPIPDIAEAKKEEELIGKPKPTSMESRPPDTAPPEDENVKTEDSGQDDQGEDEEGSSTLSHEPSPDPNRRIYVIEIIRYACTRYKLARKLMLSEKRTRDIVKPRQIGMFLSKHMTNRSLPEIGRTFGGRDHTTVLHSVRKVEELIRDDIEFAFEVASLEAQIRHMQLA
jgi:chromosomal replication initiation ATPase DnaA